MENTVKQFLIDNGFEFFEEKIGVLLCCVTDELWVGYRLTFNYSDWAVSVETAFFNPQTSVWMEGVPADWGLEVKGYAEKFITLLNVEMHKKFGRQFIL